ncbi:MAG TPA: hypothetical protein VGI16_02335 [Candidatus Acidoferrum sp.]|jgi:hypothetical protein
MKVLQQLSEIVQGTTARERSTARLFHAAMEKSLRERGWRVHREVQVPNRGDGIRGRIDLVATQADIRVAIELDNVITRKKSRFKLSQFEGPGFIILRQSARIIPCNQP